MMQEVVALVGISGVGKSTLLGKVASRLKFQHLQASSLIREERLRADEVGITGDTLHLADIDENQRLLIAAVERNIDQTAKIVVLDGHSVVDTPSGLVAVSSTVFRCLNVSQFIFLADDPSRIRERRENDKYRQRPNRDERALRQHQDAALISAFSISLALNISLSVVSPDGIERVIALLDLE